VISLGPSTAVCSPAAGSHLRAGCVDNRLAADMHLHADFLCSLAVGDSFEVGLAGSLGEMAGSRLVGHNEAVAGTPVVVVGSHLVGHTGAAGSSDEVADDHRVDHTEVIHGTTGSLAAVVARFGNCDCPGTARVHCTHAVADRVRRTVHLAVPYRC
jgi:hypothetical protein